MARLVVPNLGWVVLSEADRAVAERRLSASAAEGTRDELGFGPIHFAYANRFFPGTSVQQTRLRYIWFICWAYDELLRSHRSQAFPVEALRKIEVRTGKKLLLNFNNPYRSGIIGWTRFKVGAEPVLMPSGIYWSALKLWGLLRRRENTTQAPGQAELHAHWIDWSSAKRKDELAHEDHEPIFVDLPPQPDGWTKGNSQLSFQLTSQESKLIKDRWRSAIEVSAASEPLMSKIARAGIVPKSMWSARVSGLASADDKEALERARKAASLVCIGRALYAAMIEELKNADVRGSQSSKIHMDFLEKLRLEHRTHALSLDLKELEFDLRQADRLQQIDKQLIDLLREVQEWSYVGGGFDQLKPLFLQREISLKNSRAMLAPAAAKRRELWTVSDPAQPLNYRWPIVSTFLKDLSA
ncbi:MULTISPECIES: DUF6361 family protein [unclassified Bradyrhizobium]|uniref:DUF6361 family protein n=1 Tax=unclassified Bradyrhizobium TaxID=2631580 RepID=UPI002FF301EB